MLLLGDSIVSYGNGGWSSGIAQAAQGSIGLAGSSLLAAPHDVPYVWSAYTGARAWVAGQATDSIAAGAQSLTPSGRHYTVGGSFAFLGSGVDPVVLDLTQPLDWHVFANGTSANAQLQATRSRRTQSPWSQAVVETSDLRPVAQQASGLTDYAFSFQGTNDPGDWTSFEFTPDSRDTALYYTKLVHPNKTGITVSGWGFSGGTAQGFRSDYYNNPRFTPEGRDALYHSLVAGNSGKLNVAITFGVNDALRVTPAAYDESLRGLIADVRRDWHDAGLDPADLSFTLVSAYQVNRTGYSPARFDALGNFRSVLDAIAAEDSQVSFIDMWEAGPTWQEAVANGYLDDYVHPSSLGTTLYGDIFMQQFMPTPGDTDIDGDVDFDDLLALAQHYGQSNASWNEGDFDGVEGVTFSDLLALTQEYGNGGTVTPAQFASDWALARSMVPEPTALIGLAAASMIMSRRRRGV
jgi:hypothetical protein